MTLVSKIFYHNRFVLRMGYNKCIPCSRNCSALTESYHRIHANRFSDSCGCFSVNGTVRLKAVDTIGNCQRLTFTVCVSQHMHKITNLWKFELNRSSNLRDMNERKTPLSHDGVCIFGPQVLNLRSRNQIRWKLLLSRKLWHFRGCRFAQCFIPSTSPYYSSPRKVLWQ